MQFGEAGVDAPVLWRRRKLKRSFGLVSSTLIAPPWSNACETPTLVVATSGGKPNGVRLRRDRV